jgi:hypothetical protein
MGKKEKEKKGPEKGCALYACSELMAIHSIMCVMLHNTYMYDLVC